MMQEKRIQETRRTLRKLTDDLAACVETQVVVLRSTELAYLVFGNQLQDKLEKAK